MYNHRGGKQKTPASNKKIYSMGDSKISHPVFKLIQSDLNSLKRWEHLLSSLGSHTSKITFPPKSIVVKMLSLILSESVIY